MPLFKKHTWLLFYLIAFIGSLLLGAAFYQKYEELLNNSELNQIHLTQLQVERLNSFFHEQELVLNLLSKEYSTVPNFNKSIFTNILNLSPYLADIWLFSPQGELQIATQPNLSFPAQWQDKKQHQWFNNTLNADTLIIGQASLHQSINKWILPLSKRVTDQQGNTIAVISMGVDLTLLNALWREGIPKQNKLQAIVENDRFLLLNSHLTPQQYAEYYRTALPIKSEIIKKIDHEKFKLNTPFNPASEDLPLALDRIKSPQMLYTFEYNKRYGFWVSAEISYSSIFTKLQNYSIPYLIFYIVLVCLIYILFRWINEVEKSKIRELTHKAEYDFLTGLPNRTVIAKYFDRVQAAKDKPVALLYLDLDNFKNINDLFGHSYGDLLLIEVTKRIQDSLSTYQGIATRYSGDEFVIFIESGNKQEITKYAQLLLNKIALPYLINNNIFKISTSIGISLFPENAIDIETLLSYADNSVFIAKKKKNNFLFFSQEIHHQQIRNIKIEQALHHAITHNEISLVYQPQVDTNQKLLGVEALVRWNNKKLGIITPEEFIPIAEENGIMSQLGLYIIRKAMKEIGDLQRHENVQFSLSINVSVRQFLQIDFIEKLIEARARYVDQHTTLTIEITESLFIENIDTLLPLFHKMKANKMSLSLDDFGTGFSSLSMLRKVPIDELKIDKSFVEHIVTNNTDKAMAQNIIRMGKELGMTVLVEGVENQAQIDILQQAGCDVFQGYLFAKPLALTELLSFALKHRSEPIKPLLQKSKH